MLDFVALIQERIEENLHVPSVFSVSFAWPENAQVKPYTRKEAKTN